MKLTEVWESYAFYTEKITEQSRKLAFAASGICWFFKAPDIRFPPTILTALLCIVLFFTIDLLQYFISAMLLKYWARKQEKIAYAEMGTIDVEVDKPTSLDTAGFYLFCFKILTLFIGYILIAAHIMMS
jgi:hypothetical protein